MIMNTRELIDQIARAKWELETALEDNGGELTPELLEASDTLDEMKALLAGEGIDDLGRWLKSVQDEVAARKAEADAAARRLKNAKAYEDHVKGIIGQAMDLLDLDTNKNGEKVAKGSFYGFKRTTSCKSSVRQELLEGDWLEVAQVGARMNGLPDWVDVQIKTTTTELREAGDTALDYLEETRTPALSFTKPKANDKKKEEQA